MTGQATEYSRGSALPSSNPFQRLAQLLDGVVPAQDPIVMTIGEPQHALPDFLEEVLSANMADFRRYPPIQGTPEFRESVANWLDKRYGLNGLVDPDRGVLPLNGSREGLSFAAIAARDQLKPKEARPAVLLPNPFYQTYAAAAHIADAEAIFLDATAEGNFLPRLETLDPALLERTVAFYVASPSNPEGALADATYWQTLIGLARRHNFMILADECYSEIYRDTPPTGILEAAAKLGNDKDKVFDKIIVLNSLSKRSNLAGLRCGFAAGDPEFLGRWLKFRGLAAPQVPIPHQKVAARAFSEEAHVEENRRLYNEKYEVAEQILGPILGPVTPPAGFFLWLNISKWGSSETVAKGLFEQTGVKVLPGAYLASTQTDGSNPGAAYIRIGLCVPKETTEIALTRLATWLGERS